VIRRDASPSARRMGGAKRYPSIAACEGDGFREALNPSYALVPAIHVFLVWSNQDADARHKAGHDEAKAEYLLRRRHAPWLIADRPGHLRRPTLHRAIELTLMGKTELPRVRKLLGWTILNYKLSALRATFLGVIVCA
jgi:hypothetical protein